MFYQPFVIILWNLILRKSKISYIDCLYKYLLIIDDTLHFKPYDAAELTKEIPEAILIGYKMLKAFKGRGLWGLLNYE